MMYRNAAQPDPVEVHKVVWFAMLYTSTLGDKEGGARLLDKRPANTPILLLWICRISILGGSDSTLNSPSKIIVI